MNPAFKERTLEETSPQADCDSKVAWNLEVKMHNGEQERFMLEWNGFLHGEGPGTRQRDRAVTRKV